MRFSMLPETGKKGVVVSCVQGIKHVQGQLNGFLTDGALALSLSHSCNSASSAALLRGPAEDNMDTHGSPPSTL